MVFRFSSDNETPAWIHVCLSPNVEWVVQGVSDVMVNNSTVSNSTVSNSTVREHMLTRGNTEARVKFPWRAPHQHFRTFETSKNTNPRIA